MAYSSDLPVVPVSTLEAMACQFILWSGESKNIPVDESGSLLCMPMLDARMNEVYVAVIQVKARGKEVSTSFISQEQVIAPEKVTAPDGPFCILGSGLVYQERFSESLGKATSFHHDCWPEARAIVTLAQDYFHSGKTVSAELAQPVYLRDEVTWKKLPGR